MKKLLLATIATAALSLPVMAQNQPSGAQRDQQQMQQSTAGQQGLQSNRQASDQQSQNQSGQSQQQAQNTIRPSQLSSQQIKQIQQSLDKQGFKAGRADGKWGPETKKAVKEYQQKHNMQANGLDQQTLKSLGVNMTAQGQTGQSQGASTTGQGSSDVHPRLQPSGRAQRNAAPSNQNQSGQH